MRYEETDEFKRAEAQRERIEAENQRQQDRERARREEDARQEREYQAQMRRIQQQQLEKQRREQESDRAERIRREKERKEAEKLKKAEKRKKAPQSADWSTGWAVLGFIGGVAWAASGIPVGDGGGWVILVIGCVLGAIAGRFYKVILVVGVLGLLLWLFASSG